MFSLVADRKRGLSGRSLAGRIRRRLVHYWRNWFQRRNYVFVHHGPFGVPPDSPCAFVHYDGQTPLPSFALENLARIGGAESLEKDRLEMAQQATMWLALIDHQVVASLFTRRGRFFKQWFVSLQDEDIVIFRVRTCPEQRGRGIAPALMRMAMHTLLTRGNKAYIDCRIYNRPSIRCIEKAGFVRIATMKPITRKQALG